MESETTGQSSVTDGAGSSGDGSESTGAAEESGSGEGSSSGDGGEPLPTATGPELYMSLCSGCHGLEGEGTALGYELRHPDRELSTWVIRNGRPGLEFEDSAMAAYGEEVFSDQQLEELYDWIDAFEQPTTGEGLYADYCASCHGTDPVAGGVIQKDIADKDFNDLQEKIRQGVGNSIEPRTLYMSAIDAEHLSDEGIQAIADWM